MSNEYKDWYNDKLETYKNICRKYILHSINLKEYIDLNLIIMSNHNLSMEEKINLSNVTYITYLIGLKIAAEEEDFVKEYKKEFEDIKNQLDKIGVKFQVKNLDLTEIGNAILCIMNKKELTIRELKGVVGDYYNDIMYQYYYNIPKSILINLSYFLGVDYSFFIKHSLNSIHDMDEYYNDSIEKRICEERTQYI